MDTEVGLTQSTGKPSSKRQARPAIVWLLSNWQGATLLEVDEEGVVTGYPVAGVELRDGGGCTSNRSARRVQHRLRDRSILLAESLFGSDFLLGPKGEIKTNVIPSSASPIRALTARRTAAGNISCPPPCLACR